MKHTYLYPSTTVCPMGMQHVILSSNTQKSATINTTATGGIRGDAPVRLGGSYL